LCQRPSPPARTRPSAFAGAGRLRREPGGLYALPQQALHSVCIASVALGIARCMLDAFVELALRKISHGTGRPLLGIQAEVAGAQARLGAARCHLIDTVTEIYIHADNVAPIDVWTAPRRDSSARQRSAAPLPSPTTPSRASESTRSCLNARSSAASVTSTPYPSKSSRATPVTKPLAKSSAATRPRCSYSVVRETAQIG
jgi:acyl-CoA dehydrogenase-like protein